jgi:hypothetical protein
MLALTRTCCFVEELVIALASLVGLILVLISQLDKKTNDKADNNHNDAPSPGMGHRVPDGTSWYNTIWDKAHSLNGKTDLVWEDWNSPQHQALFWLALFNDTVPETMNYDNQIRVVMPWPSFIFPLEVLQPGTICMDSYCCFMNVNGPVVVVLVVLIKVTVVLGPTTTTTRARIESDVTRPCRRQV